MGWANETKPNQTNQQQRCKGIFRMELTVTPRLEVIMQSLRLPKKQLQGAIGFRKALLMVADSIFLFSPVVFALRNSVELEFVMLSVQRWSNNDSSKTLANCTNQIRFRFIREA